MFQWPAGVEAGGDPRAESSTVCSSLCSSTETIPTVKKKKKALLVSTAGRLKNHSDYVCKTKYNGGWSRGLLAMKSQSDSCRIFSSNGRRIALYGRNKTKCCLILPWDSEPTAFWSCQQSEFEFNPCSTRCSKFKWGARIWRSSPSKRSILFIVKMILPFI